jgi:hypothetical protein
MEIVIHGTKGGRQIFTPKKLGGLFDVTSDVSKASAIGKEAYAMRFVENNVIFSKYKIIRDVRGDKRTGFIAFSLFLAYNKKLSGKDIISLLNRVSSEYYQIYIPDNDNNLNDVRENWDFVNRISDKYGDELSTVSVEDVENLQSGTKDDAFIYYKGDEELQKYFNVPYHEEYCDYRQVLFIKEDLQYKDENPLNALRHSETNLTGKIDLENPRYKLLFNQNTKGGVRIEIKVNGNTRSSKNKIRKKDVLEISWSKPNYKTETQRGKWHEISTEYIRVDDNMETVSIEEIGLIPEKKTIILDIRDQREVSVNDVLITCKSNYESKTVNINQIIFSGEDLGKSWKVSATKGENLFLDNHPIDFQRDCPADKGTVRLQLNESKKVSFKGKLDNVPIDNIKVKIERKIGYEGSHEVEFLNKEIGKLFSATATYKNDSEKFSGKISFFPKDNDTVHIELKKEKILKYYIDKGEHGEKIENTPDYSFDDEGKDAKSSIKTKEDWELTGFKLEEGPENSCYDMKLVAQYKKKKKKNYKPIIVASLILSVLIVSAGLYGFWPKEDKKDVLLNKDEIERYVTGIELNLDTLNSYKTKWENQNSEIIEDRNFVWYKPITWIKSEEQTSDSIEDGNWEKASQWIDIATKKRNTIDQLDFKLLKDGTRYSKNQQTFRLAIMGVDSTQYDAIQERFKDISKWNLNQIADSIKVFINPKVIEINESKETSDSILKKEPNTSESPEKETTSNKVKKNNAETNKENKTEQPQKKETGNGKKTSEIKRDIQSSTITKAQLEKYKQEHPADLSNTIDLYLQFWKLVKDNNNQKNDFDSLLGDIKQDKTLKNSELKKFLDSICKNSNEFQKYVKVRGRAKIKTVNELNDKIK